MHEDRLFSQLFLPMASEIVGEHYRWVKESAQSGNGRCSCRLRLYYYHLQKQGIAVLQVPCTSSLMRCDHHDHMVDLMSFFELMMSISCGIARMAVRLL